MKNKKQKRSIPNFPLSSARRKKPVSSLEPLYIDVAHAGKLAALMEMDQFVINVDLDEAAPHRPKKTRAA